MERHPDHPIEVGDVVTLDPTAHGYIRNEPDYWTSRDPKADRKTFLVRRYVSHWIELSEMDGSLWGPSATGIDILWVIRNNFLTQARKAVTDAAKSR